MTTTQYAPAVSDQLQPELTDSSAKEVHALLEQNKGNRKRITDLRTAEERKIDAARREIASLDRVLGLLDKQDKDLLQQLHQPPVVLPMQVMQEHEVTASERQTVWDGNTPPKTDVYASDRDLSDHADENMKRLVEQWEAQAEREGERS